MKIKNLLFQPVTLHLAIDNEGLHLNAREVKDVFERQVSREIRRAAERGLISIIRSAGKQVDHTLITEITTAPEIPSANPPNQSNDMPINPKKGNRK